MGWWDKTGNRIDNVVTINEGSYFHWKISLQRTSTVELTVVVQDGAGVYVQTMTEKEFRHLKNGTHRVFIDLSAENIARFNSGGVTLPAGDYRVVVGLRQVPDGWAAYSVAAVRFETLQ